MGSQNFPPVQSLVPAQPTSQAPLASLQYCPPPHPSVTQVFRIGTAPHTCAVTSHAAPFGHGAPSSQPVRQVWLDVSQYIPPGHGRSAQSGAGATHCPLAQLPPAGQFASFRQPAWHVADEVSQKCPAGQRSTRQSDDAGTHACVA
jgi:hypothetical protein